jgi:membrane-bound lytic murein transglycosylase B
MQPNQSSFEFRLVLLLIIGLLGTQIGIQTSHAQTTAATAGSSACSSQTEGKTRAQLEVELNACTKEIQEWTAVLTSTRKESASFSRDIQALTAKINAAQANIRGKNIAIANLSSDITSKERTIKDLDARIIEGKRAIADILRKTNDINSYSLVEALLSDKNFSEFFVDIDTYASANRALDSLLKQFLSTKRATENEREELARKRQAEADAKSAIEAAKREVELSQKEKQSLLAASKSKEKSYEQVVAERQAAANKIREALFPLRDAGAIPFGTALQLAEAASAKTGVRPALILAILQQESSMGANVGSCVITNLSTGETKSVTSGRVFTNGIHPTRDLPLLQTTVKGLGRDPLNTRVSCPLSIGYGGAMGPAQFIPSTWNIIQPSLRAATGKAMPDPWIPADAIMASAILLRDNGAAAQTQAAERTAACRYYSGRDCGFAPAATYGNQVMAKANTIKLTMIDPLKGY